MSDPTLAVLAERVKHLSDRLAAVESDLKTTMAMQRWQIGAAVGGGAMGMLALNLLLPSISKALGL